MDKIAVQCLLEDIAVAESVFTVFNDERSISNFASANITIDTDADVTVICFWYKTQELSTPLRALLSILAGLNGK